MRRIALASHHQNENAKLLDILQHKIEEVDKLQNELVKKENELSRREKTLTSAESLFDSRRENFLKDAKEEKAKLIENAKKEISDIIAKMHNSDMRIHEVIELKKELEKLEEVEEEEIFDEQINVNDFVSIPSMNISEESLEQRRKSPHYL